MVAARNSVQTLLGTDSSTRGKKLETTIHHAKQPQLSVVLKMVLTSQNTRIQFVKYVAHFLILRSRSASLISAVQNGQTIFFINEAGGAMDAGSESEIEMLV
jgi:hypothetical protein